MIALVVLAAAGSTILGLSELPTQPSDPGRCRTFLWLKREPPLRIAMIDESARTMRLAQGKRSFDIAETAPGRYEGQGYRITVRLEFGERPGITDGAVIDDGSMRIEPLAPNAMAMSIPVGGMRSCR